MPHRVKWLFAAAAVVLGGASVVAMTHGPLLQTAPRETIDTSKFKLSFEENFDSGVLDRRKWSRSAPSDLVTSRTLSSNAERQVYFDPDYLGLGIQPLSFGRGKLTITARPLTPGERAVVAANVDVLPPAHKSPALAALSYSSGRITTLGRFSQKYGYFETRARFDAGRGLWPAFWLLPANGAWPPEIDVLEALGHDPQTVYATMHSSALERQTIISKLTPTDDGYHRYGVLWGPQTIDVYVDGVKTGSTKTPPDAHQPMYMILNLAVGGHWPGYPDAQTKFPATFDVDYVRAWKLPAAQTKR